MAINLLEKIREGLGLPELKKIDPNTQDAEVNGDGSSFRLGQAIIPATLAGIYNLARSDEGVAQIASYDQGEWADIIFQKRKDPIIQNIAAYAQITEPTAENKLNSVAATAIKIIRDETKLDPDAIKNFVGDQRNHILPYLPGALHVGDLLEDDTMDDQTNKMEGPVSSLMHKIESGFSGNETQEDAQRKSDKI